MNTATKFFLATLGLGLLLSPAARAQMGVGTGATTPRTMLDVNGAISVTETTAAVSSNAAAIPTGFSLVRLTGTATAAVTLTGASSPAPVSGQQLSIYNPLTFPATFAGQTVPVGQAVAFVYSNGGWQATGSNNIYTADGTLTGVRTVTQGNNSLTFTGAANLNKFSGAAGTNTAITLGRTAEEGTFGVAANTNQYFGTLGAPGTVAGDVTLRAAGANNNLFAGTFGTGATVLGTNNTERMRITADGLVGVGTNVPTQQLDVNGGLRVAGFSPVSTQGAYLQWNRSGGNGETWLLNQRGTNTGAFINQAGIRFGDVTMANVVTEYARFLQNGYYGIGTQSPGTSLEVGGGLTVTESTSSALTGASPAYLVPANVSQLRLVASATAPTGTIGLTTTAPVSGQKLVVYNSTTVPATLNGEVIPSTRTVEFVYSNGGWRSIASAANPQNGANIYTVDGTIASDRTVTLGGHSINFLGTSGNFQFNAPGNTFSTSANFLNMMQTGDQYGSSSISLQNRLGQNGLNLTTGNEVNGKVQVGVTDLTMQTQGSGTNTGAYRVKQSNVRMESRISGKSGAGPTTYIIGPYSMSTDSTEVQLFTNPSVNGTSTNGYNTGFVIGNNYALATSKLGIGSGSLVIGSRLALSPSTTESKITLYDGGVNGQTSNTAATTHYGLGVSSGQLNYDVMSGGSHVFYVNSKNGAGGSEIFRANAAGVSLQTADGPKLSITTTTAAIGVVPANTTGNVYYEVVGNESHVFGGNVVPNNDNSAFNTLGLSVARWSAIYGVNGSFGGTLGVTGATTLASLAGTGSRPVMTDANGLLSAGAAATAANTPNIYSADGTLAAVRTVTQGSNSLIFSGTGSVVKYSGGDFPAGIVLGRTSEDGAFGVNSSGIRYLGGGTGDVSVRASGAANNLNVGTLGTGAANIYTNGTQRVIVTGAGRVGIGIAAPTQTLNVAGGIQAGNYTAANDAVSTQGAYLQWNRSNGEGETWLLNQRGGSTTNNAGLRFGDVSAANVITEYARFNYLGSLGIGTTAPAYKLDVTGDIHASGNVVAGTTTLTSDRRLKTNIVGLGSALPGLMQLVPVSYDKKASLAATTYDQREMGFIAQDLRRVYPQLVQEGRDADKILSVNYTALIPVLTKAVQEQQAQIEALQAANAQLASENSNLKASLDGKASASTVNELQAALQTLRAEVQTLRATGTTASTK